MKMDIRQMKSRILGKWKAMSLQQKLTMVFVLTAVMILAVNLYMYAIINGMTGRVDEVYVSNVRMNELSAALDRVQSSTEEYLNTKSSEAMEDYYRSEQEFRRQIEELNTLVTDDVLLLTEKNIRGLSENYLSLMADIIQAKILSRQKGEEMWSGTGAFMKKPASCMKRSIRLFTVLIMNSSSIIRRPIRF